MRGEGGLLPWTRRCSAAATVGVERRGSVALLRLSSKTDSLRQPGIESCATLLHARDDDRCCPCGMVEVETPRV